MTESVLIFCAVSFFGYGASVLFSPRMKLEFARYRLERYRSLTGALQVVAAIGLLIGLHSPGIGVFSASGLSLQMACGLAVRIRIRDSFFQSLPACAYMILCAWLALSLL